MAEVIHVFPTPVPHAGLRWVAQAWGESGDDGRWFAWLVFTPADGGQPLATPRETIQSNREALAYWAGGLTPTYLDGALRRALSRAA
jgi:hypothetical protein